MKAVILLFLLCIPFVFADPFTTSELVTYVEVGSAFSIQGDVEEVTVALQFYPKNDPTQDVSSLDTKPLATLEDGVYTFSYPQPSPGEYSFDLVSQVRSRYGFIPVTQKHPFPLEDLSQDYEMYLDATEHIDSDNPVIKSHADSLVTGLDDQYEVVHTLATWTENNINYDLNSLTANVTQSASWVLSNGEGVCDELSTLLIAMLRSLDIPARFVSGMAYTNFDDLNDFGPHAWVEVYFPDEGWVPFDIAYRQYGYVDASHIVFTEAIGTDESSTWYSWRGRDVDLISNGLDIDVSILEEGADYNPGLEFDLDVLSDTIQPDSYNLVWTTVTNPHPYYVPVALTLGNVENMDIDGLKRKDILLKPSESTAVYWMVYVDTDFRSGFVYTLPLSVRTPYGDEVSTTFQVLEKGSYNSRAEIETFLEVKEQEEAYSYNRKVNLVCEHTEGSYVYDSFSIACVVENKGNTPLSGLSLCLEEDCNTFDLGIVESESFSFTLNDLDEGSFSQLIEVSNSFVYKTDLVEILVLDEPEMYLENIEIPSQVIYTQDFSLRFDLAADSKVYNVDFTFEGPLISEQWVAKSLDSQPFELALSGRNLVAGENVLTFTMQYEDANGKKYETSDTVVVELVDVSIGQHIMITLRRMNAWIENVFNEIS